jgi:hypothetical protein
MSTNEEENGKESKEPARRKTGELDIQETTN